MNESHGWIGLGPPERRFKNLGESFEYLQQRLRMISEEISSELRDRFSIEGLIDNECTIDMRPFGAFKPEVYRSDLRMTQKLERSWAGFDTEPESPEAERLVDSRVEQYLEQTKRGKSRQLEMMMTVLLHKAFGDKYIVVRSAKYDDYCSGVDNVIVNKETGDVICAFDEIRDNPRSDRRVRKESGILEKARNGGAEIIYGFTIEESKVKLRSRDSLPLFCLGLDEREYDELLKSLEYTGSKELNEVERRFLEKILESIAEQKKKLLDDEIVTRNAELVGNLNKVDELIISRAA